METEEAIRKAYDMGYQNGLEAYAQSGPGGPWVDRGGVLLEDAKARRKELWSYDPPNEKEVREWKT